LLSLPSNCAAFTLPKKARVRANSASRSAKLASLAPAKTGTSTPASRAAMPREKSAAICTCLSNGNMSGASRACSKASGSIDLGRGVFASACARMARNAVSIWVRTGTEWVYIGLVMVIPGWV
jgi:hypothetical protein